MMVMKKRNIMSTKADTLKNLQGLVKRSKIEKLVSFTFSYWKTNEEVILNEIQKRFKGGNIIVRSSAINEDTERESMAGKFISVLNVDPKNKEGVVSAIKKVFDSYKKNKSTSSFNQVLVQAQTKDILISGVIFTRGLLNNSPYYIINYDKSTESTESVTSGFEGRTIKISKFDWKKRPVRGFKNLLIAVREIEKLIPNKGLDIEFAINKKKVVIIFQARPITIKKSGVDDKEIKNKIKVLKKQYKKVGEENIRVEGERKIFADMPDWNPAEILGDNPRYLDYSLYNYIITKDAWHEARISQGYDAGVSSRLVFLFGNKPYVDAGASFSSFVPKGVSEELKRKLILFYLDKLRKNPELQDKVEFEILYTCYDFCFEKRSRELLNHGFCGEEINELRTALIELTNNLITNSKKNIKEDIKSLEKMKKNREKMRFATMDDHVLSSLNFSKILLDDCRRKGTVQFSRLARLAFVGKILLKSLIEQGVLDEKSYDSFMESINTVATKFKKDFELVGKGKISRENFIKKYYHLRPRTYDITSKRYESNVDLLKNSDIKESARKFSRKFKLNKKVEKEINDILKQEGLNFSAKELFEFTRTAIETREFLKFEFTKNLSDAIELIAVAGGEMGFNRDELSLLGVKDIFINKGLNKDQISEVWKKIILKQMKKRKINDKLELPPIILEENDFSIVKYYKSRPNYITQKKTISELVEVDKNNPETSKIKGKIVMIENGDPGYDWIFARNIAGLITKYGGVASHMSIRCAEFGIPAAIGCGILFDQLIGKGKVILDCQLKKITLLEIK